MLQPAANDAEEHRENQPGSYRPEQQPVPAHEQTDRANQGAVQLLSELAADFGAELVQRKGGGEPGRDPGKAEKAATDLRPRGRRGSGGDPNKAENLQALGRPLHRVQVHLTGLFRARRQCELLRTKRGPVQVQLQTDVFAEGQGRFYHVPLHFEQVLLQ